MMISSLRNEQRFPCKDFEEANRVRRYEVTLTATQVKALDAWTSILTGVEDQALVLHSMVLTKEAGTAYEGEYSIEVRYTDASGVKLTADVPSTVLNDASKTWYYAPGVAVAPVAGAAIGLIATDAPTTGDVALKVELIYRILQ
jgi:hypothetical protein